MENRIGDIKKGLRLTPVSVGQDCDMEWGKDQVEGGGGERRSDDINFN